jgi:ABC-type glutathione transport system ATPase component
MINFHGVNVFPETARRREIGTEIQMLFQASGASLDPCMTVSDSLSEGFRLHRAGSPGIREKTEALVGSVGLSVDCLGRLPSQLSGGERQRVALARVLAARPRLLVLDEPTSALDTLTSAQLLQLLKSAQADTGMAFLFITHDVRTALSFCDRVALLYGGVIVEEGFSAAIRAHPRHEYTRRIFMESGVVK